MLETSPLDPYRRVVDRINGLHGGHSGLPCKHSVKTFCTKGWVIRFSCHSFEQWRVFTVLQVYLVNSNQSEDFCPFKGPNMRIKYGSQKVFNLWSGAGRVTVDRYLISQFLILFNS